MSNIVKTNLGLYLMNVDKRDELFTIMNECENKYYQYSVNNKQKITFEKMPISPIFIVEKRQIKNCDDISCYSFQPLDKISQTDKVVFSLPIDIDFEYYFKPLHINEDNKKALKQVTYNNYLQLLNKEFRDVNYGAIDNDYKMPYVYAISTIIDNNEAINHELQMIVNKILG